MSAIWFVYGMNYAQNSILNGLRGACTVSKISEVLVEWKAPLISELQDYTTYGPLTGFNKGNLKHK